MGKAMRCVTEALIALVFVLLCAASPVACTCSEEPVPPTAGLTIVSCKARGPVGELAPRLDSATKTITPGAVSAAFSVRSTGEATVSIALDEVPGRGVQPDLSLVYNSAGGDGPLGVGFSLAGVSAITRCPQTIALDGGVRGVRFDEGDKLCLDGRRLVRVGESSGVVEFRTIPDTQVRVLGHFPADAANKSADNALSFDVHTPSGFVIEYGTGADGKAMAVGGVPRTFLMKKVRDGRGNASEYSYCFADGPGYTAEYALTEIRYTSFEGSPSVAPSRAVRLAYSVKESDAIQVHHTAGMALQSTLKLDEVQMVGPGDELVRRYSLSYERSPTTKRTLLAAVEECGGDRSCTPPTRFSYKADQPGFKRITTNIPAPTSKLASPMLVDLNQDGLDDVVVPDTNAALSTPENPITEWFVSYNQGSAADPPYFNGLTSAFTQTWDTVENPSAPADPSLIQPEIATSFDHNLDGHTDLWLHDVYGSKVKDVVLLTAPNHSLNPIETEILKPFPLAAPPPPPTMTTAGASIHLADLDGDHQPDRIQCVDHSGASMESPATPVWTVQLWRPTGGGGLGGFELEGTEITPLHAVPCGIDLYTVDIDADSRTDLVVPKMVINDMGTLVSTEHYEALSRLSNGEWERFELGLPRVHPSSGERVVFSDVTGDSLPDAVVAGLSERRLLTYVNEGRRFATLPRYSLYWDGTGNQNTFFRLAMPLDFDGDGRQDLLLPIEAKTWPNLDSSYPKWFVLRANGSLGQFTFTPVDPGIAASVLLDDVPTLADLRGPRVGDINGDGAPDVAVWLTDGLSIYENQAPDQDLLVAVSDGMNEHEPDDPGFVPSVSVSYTHLTDAWRTNGAAPDDPALESYLYVSHADPANGCDYPRRCAVGPRRVVSGYALNDGDGGQRKFGLRYRDGRYHRLGNGFLGFGTRIVTDLDTGAGTIERFDNMTFIEQGELHVYPFAGQAQKVLQFAPGLPGQAMQDQLELSFVDIRPTFVLTNGGKTYFTLTTERRYRREQGTYPSPQAPTKSLEVYVQHVEAQGGATTLRDSKTKVSDFDEFGNVKIVDASTAGVDLTFHTERTYKNDTDRWVLGQLQTQKECSAAAGQSQCRLLTRTTTVYGEVETEKTETADGSPQTKLLVVFARDHFGNVTGIAADDEYNHHRTSSTVYDSEGIYPVSETNAVNHTSLTEYDSGVGLLTRLEDPNKLVTKRVYDRFGRLTLEERPDGTQTTIARSRSKEGSVWRVTERTNTTGGADDEVELDSLNRPVRLFSYGPDAVEQAGSPPRQMQVIHYNRLNGKVAQRSVPTEEATPESMLLYDKVEYDAIAREIMRTTPWGAVTTTAYKGLTVEVTEPLFYMTTVLNDALGRPVEIKDAKGGLTKYSYGPFGGLSTVEDPGGAVLRTTRDALQRVTMIEDPDRGTTIQELDGFGELLTSTNALGDVTTFEVDALGRSKWRKDKKGVAIQTTTWTWDTAPHGIGRLHKLTSPDGVKTFSYNAKGQLESQSLAVTGEPELLLASVSYDEFGRPDTLSYPAPNGAAPFAVKNAYDPHGFLLTVRDAVTDDPYWHLTEVDRAGRIRKERFGNDVVTERAYYEDKQALKSIRITLSGAPTIQDLSYEYDLRLNLKSRRDGLQKQFKTERFRHDQLDRLTCSYFSEAELPLAPCVESFEYAPNGNLTYKSDVGSLKYDDPKHPHAVTNAGGDSYGYDTIGNQIARPDGMTVTYTTFDLPRSISQGVNVYTFGYDGNQARIRKTTPTTETLYLGDLYERVMDLASSATEHRYYIKSSERVIAVVTHGGPDPGTKYLHTDNIGSVDAVTNENGGVEERRSNKPFGERRNPSWGLPPQGPFTSKTTKGFTGHEEDSELGLVNAKGRMYDPRIGRFLSTDPIVSNLWRGQSLNAYSYVGNNPLVYIDPSGFQSAPTSSAPGGPYPLDSEGYLNVCIGSKCGELGYIADDPGGAADVGAAAPPVDVGTTGGSAVSGPRGVIAPPNESWKPSSPTSDGDGAIDPSWPTIAERPPPTLSDYIGMVLRLELPPDEIGPYWLAYSIRHDFVDPIRRWAADKPQSYLDTGGTMRQFSGHRDHSDEMASVLGNIVLMVAPGANSILAGERATAGRAASGGGGTPTTLFRIITESAPEANLLSNAAKGLIPRGPEIANPALHRGLSMFDSFEGAAAKVPILQRGGKTVLGIGEFMPGPGVTVEKTLGAGHYTVSGTTPDLMNSWVQSVIRW